MAELERHRGESPAEAFDRLRATTLRATAAVQRLNEAIQPDEVYGPDDETPIDHGERGDERVTSAESRLWVYIDTSPLLPRPPIHFVKPPSPFLRPALDSRQDDAGD